VLRLKRKQGVISIGTRINIEYEKILASSKVPGGYADIGTGVSLPPYTYLASVRACILVPTFEDRVLTGLATGLATSADRPIATSKAQLDRV
jgi:hypothetical protein